MRILVTGAGGFIGAHVAAALQAAGHGVVRGMHGRSPAALSGEHVVACDFSQDLALEDWLPRLAGIDAVVNGAGILRERGANTFERVHVQAPQALYQACQQAGVRKVIQISALGAAADGEFIRSKHRADELLTRLDLDWVILRPSLVYSTRGSYGGTSLLLRAMAALPGAVFLPGSGEQGLQPICVEDLGRTIVQLVETNAGHQQVIEALGPERVSFTHFLLSLRRWLGFKAPKLIRIPLSLVRPVAWLGEVFGSGPLGMTMFRMLQHGNTGSAGAEATFEKTVGFRPRSLAQALADTPSCVQDRWHARLYFLAPALRIMLGLVWVISGLTGFFLPLQRSGALLAQAGVSLPYTAPLVYGTSSADIVLGIMLLASWRIELACILMLISVISYTLFIGTALPHAWLEPFGGLTKNLPLIPAVLIMMVLNKRR